ncbi:MAG: CheR family methyltransferase [Candidatus Methanomethylicaceae archaeon]
MYINQEISDEELLYITKLVERYGFSISNFKKEFLKRRIMARMSMTRTLSVRDYCILLKRSFEEVKSLLDSTFINVSEFFRDPPLWEELSSLFKHFLYYNRFVRIWSAGCSCGEEPYSIALTILKTFNRSEGVRIIATDIDEKAIEIAMEGVYEKNALKNVPPELIEKYFIKEGERYKISQKIKQMVNFVRHDVVRDQIFTGCDFVLCRNLMIYFPRDVQMKLIEKFWSALNLNGYLILGLSEVLNDSAINYFEPHNPRLRIYRKRSIFKRVSFNS